MDQSFMQIWASMGLMVKGTLIVTVALLVYMVYVVIERLITFARGSKQSYSYVMALRDYLSKRRVDEALSAARKYSKSPVAKVVESGLVAFNQGREALSTHGPDDVGQFDVVDAVNRALERVKERETSSLRKGLGGLATIASITPFIGLFGTVFGIIHAFDLLKTGGGIAVVGPSIAEALYSTAFGLFVAIPAAAAFNYFTGRVDNFVVDMSDVSSEFIDYVLKEGRS
jgi:biopolymer transport protein ExbB/TolQ